MVSFGPDEPSGIPPTPVVGMVATGAALILIEGLLELGILHSATVYGLGVSPSAWGVPGATIALAVLLLLLTWAYSEAPSWEKGVLFLILGAISFVLGAGFVVGGIFIIVGGALACFAVWVWEVSRPLPLLPRSAGTNSSSMPESQPPTAEAQINPDKPSRMALASVIVYRPCPNCDELNSRESAVCSTCGQTLSKQSVTEGTNS